MEIVTKEEFLLEKIRYFKLISQGAVFIHPTDTIYGIGCDATNESAVQRIRGVKQRSSMPFSVIAPSLQWISEHMEPVDKKFLGMLPGPVTLILKKKNPLFLLDCSPTDGLGVRIPNHVLTPIIQHADVPFVSTSANLHGHPPITGLARLPNQLKPDVSKQKGKLYPGEKVELVVVVAPRFSARCGQTAGPDRLFSPR